MKRTKCALSAMLAFMMLLSLCACGSTAKSNSSPVPAPASYDGMYSTGIYTEEAAEMEYNRDSGFAAVAASAVSTNSTADESASGTEEVKIADKIIYSSNVTVETTLFDDAVAKIADMVATYGGWVEASSVSGADYYQKSRGTASTREASYTLRIPSEHFQTLMSSLSELGNIPYSHIYTENVSAQYYDAEARLKAYRTQETRLLEMMELAETVEDVIIIEDRLTELRYEIESLQTRLKNWDRRVSYSTVYLSVKEVRQYTPEVKADPTYGEELVQALKNGLSHAGELLKELLVFLVEVLPVLVILVPIIWLLIFLLRKLVRRSQASRDENRKDRHIRRARKAAEKARIAEVKAKEFADIGTEGNIDPKSGE